MRLPPLIIPRPRQIETGSARETFYLNPETRLIVRNGATAADRRGPLLLQAEIRARFGLSLSLVEERAAPRDTRNAILFGEARATGGGGTAKWLSAARAPAKPEGYAVIVAAERVCVAGRDIDGTLWGAQSVIQLLDGGGGQRPCICPVRIHDWPALRLRAVHLFYGKAALPFQKKLIDRVLSRFKMNGIFIQCEQVRWNAGPSVAPSWAGTPAQIREEIAFARARGMTIYPLMEAYGHMEWLLTQNGHRDFAEDPATPYALDFTNPAAVAYLDRFVCEADDLFAAPAFHAGLDEVTMRGRLPYRSPTATLPDLYLNAVRHWHDLLAARHKTLWMWADMALNHDDVAPAWGSTKSAADAAAIRAGLPKDIVMVDWQYGDLDSYPSLKRLKEAGFTNLVAATWFKGENIRKFSRAAADIGALGAIQTTWAGYESREKVLQTDQKKQFVAMILAADYFWNGGEGPPPRELPYKPEEVFAKQWGD